MRKLTLMSVVAIVAFATQVEAAFLASLDFDSGFFVAPGVIGTFGSYSAETATLGPWNASGWAGNIAVNRTSGNPASFTTLSLFNLPGHSAISASFILGFLESWDSRNGAPSPDELEIWIDGVMVASMTSDNASGSIEDYDGGTELFDGIQANAENTFFNDTLVRFATTFSHTASSLNIGIRAAGAGWQGGGDEAWGIDNIQLQYEPAVAAVPEPASMLLLLASLPGFVLCRRRCSAR